LFHSSEEIVQTKSVSQEEQLLQVRRMRLEPTVENLNAHLQRCTSETVFNLEEVVISDWKDRKKRKVIAPAAMLSPTMHHRISRNIKHISVIACAFTTRKSLIAWIILSHDFISVRKALKKHHIPFGTD
jgi:hypothetical protein